MKKTRPPDIIYRNWSSLPAWRKLHIRLLISRAVRRFNPVYFSLYTACLTIIILPLFPTEPLTLPAVIGSAISLALITETLA